MKPYERFLKYVAFPTMSDEKSETVPSTEKQVVLSLAIAAELMSMGLADVELDDKGYLYATLPANTDKECPTIGLVAHVDTSDACADAPIAAKIVAYEGGDICLNEQKGIYMTVADYPSLQNYAGQHLIVTDGTTLLGADDKAGVAAIVSAVERLLESDAPHGKVRICFTPDEEIGRGADHFDVEKFGADYAYTVDGGPLGELEYENFNAASAVVNFAGVSIHPGSAKDKMKNAQLMAMEFNALLPADQIPAKTEGYEGFFHLTGIEGACDMASLSYIIRDHDKNLFKEKIKLLEKICDEQNKKYGEGTVTLSVKEQYLNMREKIEPHMHLIENAKAAALSAGVIPAVEPIRGGTDGARLSFMGLPCPNLGTGGYAFHGPYEHISVEGMDIATEILLNIVKIYSKEL